MNSPSRTARGLARVAAVAVSASLPLAVSAGSVSAQSPASEPTPPPTAPAPPPIAPPPPVTGPGSDMPNVVLSKTVEPRDPARGETITITVVLTNESAMDAVGYVLHGAIPPEVIDLTWECTASGAGSACGVDSGAGDLRDTADVGAGGTVSYVLTGAVAPDADAFTQAVTLEPGPGQACEPVVAVSSPRPAHSPAHYGYPRYIWEMTCRVNNDISPQPVPQETPPPVPQQSPAVQQSSAVQPGSAVQPEPVLPQTGVPFLAYLASAAGAILLGVGALRLSRRRV